MRTYTPPPVDYALWDGTTTTFNDVKGRATNMAKGVDLLAIVVALTDPVPGGDVETVLTARVGEYVVFDPSHSPGVEVMSAAAIDERYPGLIGG